jgi:muramidase (phage lysozyme)
MARSFLSDVMDLARAAGIDLGQQGGPSRPRSPFDSTPLGQARRAFMDTIAGYESPSYNTMYGGTKFSSYADHPRTGHRIGSGPNKGRLSSAAGRYQFKTSTWDRLQRELGLPDFSPQSQDIAGYQLAKEDYAARTGQNLDDVLATGDPSQIAAAASDLHGTWTSLPGGIETQTGTKGFARAFARNLNAITQPELAAADVPTPTPRPDVAEVAPPIGNVESASLPPVPSTAERVPASPSLASMLSPVGAAYAEPAPTEKAPALQAMERLVGVEQPDVPSPQQLDARMAGLPARPDVPAMPTPDVAMTEDDVQRMEREQGMFQPAAPQNAPARPAVSANATPAQMTPAEFAGFVGLQPDRAQAIAPTEKVNPIGYEMTPPMPATEHVNPIGYEMQAPEPPSGVVTGTEPQAPAMDLGKAALGGMMKGMMGAPMAPGQPTTQAPPMQAPKSIPDLPVAQAYPETPTISAIDKLRYDPVLGRVAKGALMGGIPGALAAGVFGGPSFDDNQGIIPQADRFSAGVGAPGIEAAMAGQRGATGRSLSNPGASVTSRGPGMGYDLTNALGAITHYMPNGSIAATPYSGISLRDILGHMFGGSDHFTKSERDYTATHPGLY